MLFFGANTWNKETNVKGTYSLIHYFIKATGGKGTIINLVPLGASLLFPGMSSYAGSKLAVIKLGESIDVGKTRASGISLFTITSSPANPIF